jgi:hypothetical protein
MSSPRERVTEHSPYYRWGQIQTADLSAVNNLVRESNISPLATSADAKERGRRKTKFTTETQSSQRDIHHKDTKDTQAEA